MGWMARGKFKMSIDVEFVFTIPLKPMKGFKAAGREVKSLFGYQHWRN